MSNAHRTETLDEFNARCAESVRRLHDDLAAAGHAVTPEEAKFLWVAGQAALAETLGLDSSPLNGTLRRLAADLPKAA